MIRCLIGCASACIVNEGALSGKLLQSATGRKAKEKKDKPIDKSTGEVPATLPSWCYWRSWPEPFNEDSVSLEQIFAIPTHDQNAKTGEAITAWSAASFEAIRHGRNGDNSFHSSREKDRQTEWRKQKRTSHCLISFARSVYTSQLLYDAVAKDVPPYPIQEPEI